MRKITQLLFGFLIAIFLSTAQASLAPIYQIEIIVFSHITPQSLQMEHWLMPKSALEFPNNTRLIEPTATTSVNTNNINNTVPIYFALPNTAFQLNKETKAIKLHPDYKILLHTTWYAPTKALQKGLTFRLYGGNGWITQPWGTYPVPKDWAFADPSSATWEVNGLMHIDLDHYFNIHMHFVFTEPAKPLQTLLGKPKKADDNKPTPLPILNNIQNNYAYFTIDQKRRTRSRLLNYIDHPLYGVLIELYPVKDSDQA